uniref:Uncharacterized protein n=1 Tax=Octopus bimaculoides TaxID=37653 RepID=A0A0L8G6R0_OCTBM
MSSMYRSLFILIPGGTKTSGVFPVSEMDAQTITDAGFLVLKTFPALPGIASILLARIRSF